MAVVIGKPADHVSVSEARQHIFGFTVHVDVSDRSGQRSTRFGTDWLVGKSHATFAPLGPFIVPREFVPDPQKLKITYTLNGKVMQDADTSLMVHSIDELVSYGSNILPLQPGDVINTGSPAGVGYAQAADLPESGRSVELHVRLDRHARQSRHGVPLAK